MTNEQNSVSTTGALINHPQQVGDEAESYYSGCCFHRWSSNTADPTVHDKAIFGQLVEKAKAALA